MASVVALVLSVIATALITAWIVAVFRRAGPAPIRVCYRCGTILTPETAVEYMGLPFCRMDRSVVVAMAWLIPLGPPFGFPGAPGYLEPPETPHEPEGLKPDPELAAAVEQAIADDEMNVKGKEHGHPEKR